MVKLNTMANGYVHLFELFIVVIEQLIDYNRWLVDFGQNFDNRFHFSESIKSEISKLEKKIKTKDCNLLNEKQLFFFLYISICSI